MDVDTATSEVLTQLIREHLHVAGKHNQVHVMLIDQLPNPVFLSYLGLKF